MSYLLASILAVVAALSPLAPQTASDVTTGQEYVNAVDSQYDSLLRAQHFPYHNMAWAAALNAVS